MPVTSPTMSSTMTAAAKISWKWGTFPSGTFPTEQKGFEQTPFDKGASLKTSCCSIFLSLLRSVWIIFPQCLQLKNRKKKKICVCDGSTVWESFFLHTKAGNNQYCLFPGPPEQGFAIAATPGYAEVEWDSCRHPSHQSLLCWLRRAGSQNKSCQQKCIF